MYRVREVCERISASPSTVYWLIERGFLGHYRCPGIRVSEEQLQEYLESTKRGRTQAEAWPEKTRPRLEKADRRKTTNWF